jgi:hypothetical protein
MRANLKLHRAALKAKNQNKLPGHAAMKKPALGPAFLVETKVTHDPMKGVENQKNQGYRKIVML